MYRYPLSTVYDIAETKGVHREVESEGRRRQTSGLTDRNHIRLQLRIRLPNKLKSNNYSGWLRHKIRAIYWKQWKKVKTRYRMIKKYGMPEWKVHEMANSRKGIWRSALMLNSVLTKQEIVSLGYISMTDYYLKVCEN